MLLTLVLALGLATPTLAAEGKITEEEFYSHYEFARTEEGVRAEDTVRLMSTAWDEDDVTTYYYGDGMEATVGDINTISAYSVISPDCSFMITNTAVGIDCELTVNLGCWSNHAYDASEPSDDDGFGVNGSTAVHGPEIRLPKGDYLPLNLYEAYLYKDGTWNEYVGWPPPEDELLTLAPGQSFTFDLNDISFEDPWSSSLYSPQKDNIIRIGVKITYPEQDMWWSTNYYFRTGGEVPAETEQKPNIAYASTQTVQVDGKNVEFQCYALKDTNGNATNYIKLRDLAMHLNGTAAQFQVGWDGSVTITTKTAYTSNGSELKTPYSGDRAYQEATAATKVNGQAADLAAFVLNDDNGGGYTYYQLRDLGKALGFNVGWAADKGIFVETNKPYDPAN